jgi:hypothetical protein
MLVKVFLLTTRERITILSADILLGRLEVALTFAIGSGASGINGSSSIWLEEVKQFYGVCKVANTFIRRQ